MGDDDLPDELKEMLGSIEMPEFDEPNDGKFKKGNKAASVGRKSHYRPKLANVAEEACKRGLTDLEIAEMLDISESTLLRWKHKYPLFAEAFRLGKKQAHDRVERALYHKAVGYTYTTDRIVAGHKVTLKQHLPPDTAAAVFYLKNRRPQKWRDIQRHESGPAGAFDKIDDAAELRRQLAKLAAELGLIAPAEVKMIEGTAIDVTEKSK